MKNQNKTRKLLIGLLMAGLFVLPSIAMAQEEQAAAPAPAPVPTITTDQQDYAPWELVTIHGSGFEPDSAIVLTMVWPDQWVDGFSGTADDSGAFTVWYGKEKYEGTFTVTATDDVGTTATITFTDAAALDYSPKNQSLAADPGGSASFLQTVTAPKWNGNFTASLAVAATGTTPIPPAWVSTYPVSLTFSTGAKPAGSDDIESWTVTFSIPTEAAAGTYTANIKANPSISGVGPASGTSVTLTVNAPPDKVPPVTTLAILTGTVGSDDWYISDVQVQLTATDPDNGKGVDKIYYKLNSGADTTYSGPFWISTEGKNTVEYWAVDKATPPNVEVHKTKDIWIDKTAISNASVTINDGALYTSSTSVTLALEAHDAVGGVSEYDITDGSNTSLGNDAGGVADFVLPSKAWTLPDGDGTKTVTVSYYDVGGNPSVSPSDSIVLDTQGSTVTFDPSLTPPASGWFTTPQTSTVTAAEVENCIVVSLELVNDSTGRLPGTLTGVTGLQSRSASGTVTAATDGLYTIICKATDGAGNPGQATVMFGIDSGAPVIAAGTPTGTAGTNGWWQSDVTVPFSATDNVSGFDPDGLLSKDMASKTTSGEGSALSVMSDSISDRAGNTAEGISSGPYKVDKTAPVITAGTATGTEGNNGWWRSDVTVPFSATDDLSGFDADGTLSKDTASQTTSGEGSALSVTSDGISDWAGNAATGVSSGPYMVDKTAPTITGSRNPAANSYGWNNGDVTVSFTASDDLSGLDTVSGPTTLSGEGAGQSVTGTALDKAGNSASTTVSGINIDKTAPTVTITTPANGAVYLVNQTVNVDWTATDALSGIASSGVTSAIDTATAGAKTFTVTATDKAGNVKTVSVSYSVYTFSGILQPINADNTSLFKLGSTVPVKFQLRDASGAFVTNAVAKITLVKLTGTPDGTVVEATSTSAATSGNLFRYDSTSNQYIFNLATRPLSVGTWQIYIDLGSGALPVVRISLR